MDRPRCQMNTSHPATYQCSCSNPSVTLCLQCIDTHFDEPGDHTLTRIVRPQGSKRDSDPPVIAVEPSGVTLCQMCNGLPATDFCCCRFPVALLCKTCQGQHWKRNTEAVHNFVPISFSKKITCSGDIAQLSQYLSYLSKGKKYLIEVIRRITSCQDALKVKHKQMLKIMNDVFKNQLDELEKLKVTMTNGVNRASESVREFLMDAQAPQDPFTSVFWYYTRLKDPKILELFDFNTLDEKPDIERIMGVNWKSKLDTSGQISESYIYQNKQKILPQVRSCAHNLLSFLYSTSVSRSLLYSFENHLGVLYHQQKSQEMVTRLCNNMLAYVQEAELMGPIGDLITDTITLLLRSGFTTAELKETSNLEYFLTRQHRLPIELSTLIADTRKRPLNLLVEVRTDLVAIYDCANKAWTKKVELNRTINVSNFSATGFLSNGHLLVCGGNPSGVSIADAYDIDLETGAVAKLDDMKTPRHGHGILAYFNVVYVFGGYDTASLGVCEKYVFRISDWLPLKNQMITARSWFNPALYKHLVYLCGGNQVVQCEVFDPSTETFSALPMLVPDPGNTRTVVANDHLIIVTWNKICRLNLAKEEKEFVVASHWTYATWGAMSPLVLGPELFFVAFNNGAIRAVSLSTGQKVREDTLCPFLPNPAP